MPRRSSTKKISDQSALQTAREVSDEQVALSEAPEVPDTHHRVRRAAPIVVWFFILLLFSATLYFIPPETMVAHVGVSNAYALILVLSFLGGVMTFSGVPYHLFLVSFVLAGMNPWILGIIAGLGVTLGDVTSYFVGYYGRVLLTPRLESYVQKIEILKERHPRLLPLIFFLYSSVVPYSSDVFTIPMGLIRYPFFRLMIPLVLGSMIFNIGLAFLALYAYDYLSYVL